MALNYNSPNLADSVFLRQQTDFTTLKYGMDQPQGGNSGLPYVKFPMQDAGPVTNAILQFYQKNRKVYCWNLITNKDGEKFESILLQGQKCNFEGHEYTYISQ